MKDFYAFTIEILSEYNEIDTISGFVIAENYSDASKNIIEYYGEYLLKLKLEYCCESPVLEL